MAGETEETSVAEDVAFLASDENVEEEPLEELPTEEEVEETEEEDDTEGPEEVETEEKDPEEAPEAVAAKDRAKEVTAKYPNLFKEFPDLRKALFQYDQYSTVFPTIELAKEAAGKVEHFEALGASLLEGDSGSLLDSIHDVDPKAVSTLATNFLPTLYSRSPELWRQAVDPVLREVLLTARNRAVKDKNVNLGRAYQIMSEFLYGEKEIKAAPKPQNDPEKEALKKRLAAVETEKNEGFIATTKSEIDSSLSKAIEAKLTAVPASLRSLVVEKAIKQIGQKLGSNPAHVQAINRLGEAAKRVGFTDESRKAIVDAYTRPARQILGTVVAEIVKGLGKTGNGDSKVRIPQGAAPGIGSINGKIDHRKVDWTKTSDKDFLAGKVVAKR